MTKKNSRLFILYLNYDIYRYTLRIKKSITARNIFVDNF